MAGVGGYVPERLVTNDDLAAVLDTSDEWISSRTGIRQRYWAAPGQATSDLAAEAGKRALKSAGESQTDAVVVATTTPDMPCPATAPTVATKLGLTGAAAYDVAAVCTGFLYALATASGLIATGTARRVLVIGAETYSGILDPADRTTSVIFGDGAGAVVLRAGEPDEPGVVGPFVLGSDGSGADLITVPGGGSRERLSGREPDPADRYFQMEGKAVFRQAVTRMAQSAREVTARHGWSMADLDWIISHQANQRIINQLADELRIPRDRSLGNIARVGNTAGASIPLALAEGHEDGRLRPGDRILLSAFGGGLTWGSTVLTWPAIGKA